MAAIVDLIGHSMGGRPAEYLMRRIGMPVSDDAILRQIKRRAAISSQDPNIRIVGIDDWSWRRSTVENYNHMIFRWSDDQIYGQDGQYLSSLASLQHQSKDPIRRRALARGEAASTARSKLDQVVARRFSILPYLALSARSCDFGQVKNEGGLTALFQTAAAWPAGRLSFPRRSRQ